MKLVNRSALSVRPTQAFVDWINSLEATEGEDDLTLEDVEHESTVYLIPEMDTEAALNACLGERFADILENELAAWEESPRLWPDINETTFRRFLRIEHSYLAVDLDDEAELVQSELEDGLVSDSDNSQ
ncbi:hypothetical protein [Kushneria aurantia]|uniref:VacJ n=1 Tax=Kushneria aurantia TaxID=504092 RepID=A0ABV6G5B0_9GAMM|nr:hypothetical protein [Kushneria aurantia]